MAKIDSKVTSRFLIGAVLVCALIAPLAGCENWEGERSLAARTDPVSLRLAEAADKASAALQSLARMEQSQKPIAPESVIGNAPADLQTRVTVDWNGPIEPLLQNLASQAHYRFIKVGKTPAVPVIVRMNVRDRPVVEQLQSASLQATGSTDIIVNALTKTIELHYVTLR